MSLTITPKMAREADRYIAEPLYWARKFGGDSFDPWSGQERCWIEYGKLLNAKIKRYKQYPMTEEERRYASKVGISIKAGQGVGKGATISLIGLHYLFALQSIRPKVVCTAPAGPQLHSSLWPEYGAWMQRSELLNDFFEKNAKRIFLKDDRDKGNVSRIEPRTVQPNANAEEQKVVLAGIHALGVMYQCDEASGIPEAVFEPLEGGLTDPLSMIIMIFNPTKRQGFAIESHRKNREQWICLHWDGEVLRDEKLKSPGQFLYFNEEIQLAHARKYGVDSDFYRVRVKGLEPNQTGDTLISFDSVMDATERQIETLDSDPLCIPVDVGGADNDENSSTQRPTGDPSIVMPFRGPKVVQIYEYQNKKTTELQMLVAGHLRDQLAALPSDVQFAIGVDVIGIGRGLYHNLQDLERLRNVYGIDVSEKALDEKRYHRLRDQLYWEAREAFMEHREPVIPNDEVLIAELTSIKWGEVNGKIKIQGKGLSSGIPGVKPLTHSPNRADAFVMGWYLYKHCCSRMPAHSRRERLRQRVQSIGNLGFRSARIR
jgi:hypothetical protein